MQIDVRVEDQLVNIVSEGRDAGIRLVEAIDKDMVQVRLTAPDRLVVVAAPRYLRRRGTPHKPSDLLQHDCIGRRFATNAEPWAWELERGKRTWRVPVQGSLTTNDPELMRRLAIAGVGLVYGLESSLAADIARGRLAVVLEAYAPAVPGLFLYFPSRAQVSPALKALVALARELTGEPRRARSRRA